MKECSDMNFKDKARLKCLLLGINGKDVDIFKDCNLDKNMHKVSLHSKSIKLRILKGALIGHYQKINMVILMKVIQKLEFI